MSLQSIFNNSWDKLQTFFSEIDWSKVLPFFLFLILAFFFWLLLFFDRKDEGSYRIPIKYVNIPKQEVFVETMPNQINLKIKDFGRELLKYKFKMLMKRDSLHIDVTEAQKNNETKLEGNQLTQLIRNKIFANTEIIGYLPASISVRTSKLDSKTVPVVFDGEKRTSANYLVIDTISIIPNEVTISSANKNLLSSITEVATEYTVFENLEATSQLPAKLKPIEGVTIQPNQVDIYIPIYEFTERDFEIPIVATDSPEGYNVKFFPSKVRVTFSVTLDDYKKISPDDFEIKLDYNTLRDIEGDLVELKLSKFPPSIKNPHLSPGVAEFLFEQK